MINGISILIVAQIEKYISLSALHFCYKSNQQANSAVLPLAYLHILTFYLPASGLSRSRPRCKGGCSATCTVHSGHDSSLLRTLTDGRLNALEREGQMSEELHKPLSVPFPIASLFSARSRSFSPSSQPPKHVCSAGPLHVLFLMSQMYSLNKSCLIIIRLLLNLPFKAKPYTACTMHPDSDHSLYNYHDSNSCLEAHH